MQFKLFVIPVTDSGESLDDLNKFLRNDRLLEESHGISAFAFCKIRFIK